MEMKRVAKNLAYWLLPMGFYDAIKGYGYPSILFDVQNGQLSRCLKGNRRFYNKHRGERCFILCNGPSVLKQDLLPLRNEVVMSVSSGYLHKDFERIKPAYHLVPTLPPVGMLTEQDFVLWFREMDSRLGDAEMFLGSSEFELLKRHSLFPQRKVHFYHGGRQFRENESAIIDITRSAPQVITVPIMCLIVALYMGFKNIYLLGTEHDTVVTREYKYAFAPTALRGKDFSTDVGGKSRVTMYEEMKGCVRIWEQYRHIKRIAMVNNVSIWNATAGGVLDEFPRVELAEVLRQHRS